MKFVLIQKLNSQNLIKPLSKATSEHKWKHRNRDSESNSANARKDDSANQKK